MGSLTLDEIRLYPVKGLRGISVRQAEVEPWGLKHDRRWMIVDLAGRFITQRQIPRMAIVKAEPRSGGLTFSDETFGSFEEPDPAAEAETVEVTVWDDVVLTQAASRGAADWLTRAIGAPCRLVHMGDPAKARPTDPAFSEPQDRVSFADGFPLLATTRASLDDLNRRLPSPTVMDRFRPNIVITGALAWEEDSWSRLRVGGVDFAAVKDCARCVVTTVDQDTGLKAENGEPLRTLASFRRRGAGRIIFGENLIPRSLGRLTVGDAVAAEKRAEK